MNVGELRAAFSELPFADKQPPDHTWERHRWEIIRHVKNDDPERFLRWSTIQATMFPCETRWIMRELDALRNSDEWPRWAMAITEPFFGDPPPMPSCRWTSGNLVHQAYHLFMWEVATGRKIHDLGNIYEFGGGYGAMAMVATRAGFSGDYFIQDVAEVSILQEYYLSNVGVDAILTTETPDIGTDLIVGCYSFSEVPIDLRESVLAKVKGGSYLFAYQDMFYGVNNLWWFEKFAEGKDDLAWTEIHVEHLPGRYYLIGNEDEASPEKL